MAPLGTGRRTGARLFAVYAAASLVLVAALGLVLIRAGERDAVARGLAQGRTQASLVEEMAIAPTVPTEDLSVGLSEAEHSRLRTATDLALFNGSVLSLKLRSFSGDVVFSDNGSADGALPTTHPSFRAAAAGATDVTIIAAPVGPGQAIRVLMPVIPNASGRATGVLELTLPYDDIAKDLDEQNGATLTRLGIGLGALYVVLALISWSSTRGLRRHAAEREHQALHDPLTGLPNREGFRIRAEAAMERARNGEHGALVLVDLDRFKLVNDTLGHHAGDELLREVGRRLCASLRGDDTVARLGGDEFGLILPRAGERDAVVSLLERVRRTLAAELELENTVLSVEASFGVAFYPEDATDVERLLQRADSAMYQGKRGAEGVVVYDAAKAASQDALSSLMVQRDFRTALQRGELVLHYQPKLDLATREICGVEALVRWQHPTEGLLPPGAFLPAVEQSALIGPLTDWVLRRALEDQKEWSERGRQWPVSVNVSVRNLEAPHFAETVSSILSELDVRPDRLVLEVTETALALNAETAARAVAELAGQGITISIDDFGIGYTSIAQLRSLAVDEVKIDRAFVAGVDVSEQDRAIVGSIIQLAQGLGCRVTAEGVEAGPAAEWLTVQGCDRAQGFYFARPAPWQELAARYDEQGIHA